MNSYIAVMNTPMSEVLDGKCKNCGIKVKNEGCPYYCKIGKGKRWYYLYPCSVVSQLLCPRLATTE